MQRINIKAVHAEFKNIVKYRKKRKRKNKYLRRGE